MSDDQFKALCNTYGFAPSRALRELIDACAALRAALAEPEGWGNLPPPLQEPKDFDHAIGADRFKVVRGAFWWHVLIGDSPTEHGKFRSRASAEKMAADLLREFRNGAFVQHEAALAEPVQEPVAWIHTDPDTPRVKFLEWREDEPGYRGDWIKTPLFTAPFQPKELNFCSRCGKRTNDIHTCTPP